MNRFNGDQITVIDDPPDFADIKKESRLANAADKEKRLVRDFRFLTAAELAAGDFAIEYLVRGMFAKNQPAIMAAPSKSLKTTIGLDLAISLASGEKFLNTFHVPIQQRVLVMTGESGLATVQETIKRIAFSKSARLDPAAIPNLFVCDAVPLLNNLGHINSVEEAIRAHEADVLICDPVYLMVDGGDAGNLFTMGAQLKPLADICQAEGVTLLLVHHTKRGSQNAMTFEPMGLEDIAWSGFAEFTRQWIFLNRRERYEDGTGFHRLWLNYGGSAGHSGLWAVDVAEGTNTAAEGRDYEITITEAREARRQIANSQARERESKADQRRNVTIENRCEKIIGAFYGRADWLSQSKLKERTGFSGAVTNEAIAKLVSRGKLEAKTDKIQGTEREVFRPVLAIRDI